MQIRSSSKLEPAHGFHPTIATSVNISTAETDGDGPCSLYLHYRLPKLVYVDRHEVALRKEQYELLELKGVGERELERPVHAIPDDGASESGYDGLEALIHLSRDISRADGGEDVIRIDFPIHLRYPEPTDDDETLHVSASLDSPLVVARCEYGGRKGACSLTTQAEIQLNLLSEGGGCDSLPPLFRRALGPALDGSLCFTSVSEPSSLEVAAPVGLRRRDLGIVELGTSLTIAVCFLWLLLASWRTYWRLRRDPPSDERKTN